MPDRITRRDFLDGFAIAIGAGLAAGPRFAAAASSYPPGLTGERGSTPSAYSVAHSLLRGRRFRVATLPVDAVVDLAIIGAGISGLAAAHFYLASHPKARVLILDNHDDFGGQAQRNEFTVDGRLLVGYGGTESITSPNTEWSPTARGLLTAVGIDVERLGRAFDRTLYPDLGLSRGIFFKKETFGLDALVSGDPTRMVADDIPPDRSNAKSIDAFVAGFPLPPEQKRALVALYTEGRDVLKGQSVEQKEAYLWTLSYRDFLQKHWGLSDLAARTFQGRSYDLFALGIDAVSAHDAMDTYYPGFQGLGLTSGADPPEEPYIHHFPDGCASLARALVRELIPSAAPGTTMDDIVTARFDYSKLDQAGADVRLRLRSTVVHIENLASGRVDIGYLKDGRPHRVQAARTIFAGYGAMLPYVFPELEPRQSAALASAVRAPLVYVNVAVKNWRPWVKLGVHEITNAMGFFSRLKLDYPVSLGAYKCPRTPGEPIVLHLVHVPAVPFSGLDQRAAWRKGRARLQAMPFSEFETQVRDELTRMLGPGGFDASRDIAAITVNRWGHGYSYVSNSLFEQEPDPPLYVVAQKTVGRVAIAGSDASGSQYMHAGIDDAYRAVGELG
jgi:spermidine dehydrogenase